MALTKYTQDTSIIGQLGTRPEDRPGMTDQQLKDKFDENALTWKEFWNNTASEEIDALIAAIKGAGWTSESLKGLADLLSSHTADLVTDADGAHGLKIETGTWTPTIAGSTTAGANTYNLQVGSYYKIGNLVTVEGDIMLTAKDAAMAGDILIKGLPFASKNVSNLYINGVVGYYYNLTGLTAGGLSLTGQPNSTSLGLHYGASNNIGTVAAANITNATRLMFSVTYLI